MNTAALRFELMKIRTLRSTPCLLAVSIAVSIGVGVLSGYYIARSYRTPADAARANIDPVAVGFSGVNLGLLALVVFAVLTVTGEYSTGSIRSSLAAVPRRAVFFGSKIVAGTLVVFTASTIAVFTSFLATQVAMGDYGVPLGGPDVVRALGGGVVHVTLLSAFSMGLAALLRSSVATIALLTPVFFTISTLLTHVPGLGTVARYLPDQAGLQMMARAARHNTDITPFTGLLVLLGWTALSLLTGYWAVSRRDS
jgi:ABC-2 type transport system permease protein